MNNEPISVVDLKTLQREKQRLKIFCSYQEQVLQDKFKSIKTHYSQIIGEEFLPYNKERNRKISNLLDLINDFITGKLLGKNIGGKNKLTGLLLKITQIVIIRVFDSFLKKKE
jgi:hypothetical protein